MANNIKGITVEIGGDTGPLSSALKGVNKTAGDLQSELREVNRQLKFDPGNTELLTQKQAILAKEIDTTKEKLGKLKETQGQVEQQFQKGEIGEEKYRAFRREVEKTESQLKDLEEQAGKVNAALSKVSTAASKVSDGAGKMATATKGMSTAAAGILGGAAVAAEKVVSAYAGAEQLIGGVETLFKGAAGTVEKYADQAYKTAGLSANEYMETVTGFSASLIQSLDGDTQKAAEYANTAITDMSDNANKMGSDMSSIQQAYQGFAKQNYTMLDNLHLGYGGTKTEMERLLEDAGKIAGVKFNISSYSDIIQAIHVMQQNMGIAGTTAKEAEGTISGSIEAAKSSVTNLVSGLGQSGADVNKLTKEVADSVTVAVKNIIPVLKSLVDNLPSGAKIALGVTAVIAVVSPILLIISKVASGISALSGALAMSKTATLAQTAAQYGMNAALLANPVTWIVVAIVAAVALLVVGIKHLWDTNEGFRTAVTNIWNGIKTVISTVVNVIVGFFTVTIPQAWNSLVTFFTGVPAWWSNLWTQVGDFFTNLWNGIISFFTQTIPQWVQSFIQWINQLPYNIGLALGTMLASIVNFGVSAWSWVTTKLPQIINGIIQWFQQLPGRIWAFLVDVVNKIGLWGNNMVQKAAVEVPRFISKVISFIQQLPGKIWTFLVDTVNKVVTWAENLVTTAQTEIPKFVSTVVSFIGELPGKMLDIGKNIVTGIWDGINGAIDWLHDKIKSFCDGIVAGFKKNLKIHSPSQVLADEVGKFMALGIGQGFTDSMKPVTAAMAAAIPTDFSSSVRVRTAMAAAYGGYSASTTTAGSSSGSTSAQSTDGSTGGVKVYQYFQGETPSAAETARQTRNGLQQVVKKLKG